MKTKLLISLFSVLALFVFNGTAFATSGACSSHGGVSCSLSNSYGGVICNDGYSESATSYSDLEECKNVTSCSVGSVTSYAASRGLIGSSFYEAASSRCSTLNSSSANYSTPTYSQVSNSDIEAAIDRKMVKYCVEKYGTSSIYDPIKVTCGCKTGYLFNESKICTSKEELVDIAFKKEFNIAILTLPEYKNIADPAIIKNLSLKPENSAKTFIQLITETYANKVSIATSSQNYSKLTNTTLQLTTPASTAITLSKNLKIGSKDPEVKLLQYLLGIEQSGYFGVKTRDAVIRFQKLNKIPSSGLVGSLTRNALNK